LLTAVSAAHGSETPLESLVRRVRSSCGSSCGTAKTVASSPTPTLRRLKSLEAGGVIAGYRAVIDAEAVGRGFRVLVRVDLEHSTTDAIAAFEDAVCAIDEVTDCYRLFGEPDYLLHVAVKDAETYEQVYITRLAALPGIRRAVSQIIMKPVRSRSTLTPPPTGHET
jgi:Lrp/AsnC family leucine-responsive transcriptional regulator